MTDADVTALRATAHPLRLRMLSLLTGASMSAAELARELDTTQANASYHLRVLADAGEVVPDGEEVVRGGVAKKYRHPWNQPARTGRSGADEGPMVRAIATEMTRRWSQRAPETKTYLADAEMWVDPDVWSEALDLLHQAVALVHDRARPPRSEGTVPVNLQAVAFRLTEPR